MAPQLPGAVLAPPLNNIGPSKDIIKPIYGAEGVAIFGWWLCHLWQNGTLFTFNILHIFKFDERAQSIYIGFYFVSIYF